MESLLKSYCKRNLTSRNLPIAILVESLERIKRLLLGIRQLESGDGIVQIFTALTHRPLAANFIVHLVQ